MRVIGDIARLHAKRNPDKTALIMDNNSLTFRQLNERANQVAHGLVSSGVRPGDRIAIIAHNCLDFVVVTYGVAKCGAILVPANFRYKRDELVYLIKNCEPNLLFYGPEFTPMIEEAKADFSPLLKIAALSGEPLEPGLTLEGLLMDRPASDPNLDIDPESAFVITYTSGTTGAPKGVLASHRAFLNIYTGMALEGDIRPQEVTLVNLPLFHTGGMHALVQPTLLLGGTVIVMGGGFDPDNVLDTVSRHEVTLAMWVPTMLAMLVNHPEAGKYDLSTLEKIWYGSSAISPPVLEASMNLFKSRFYQWYGQTETGMVSVLRPEDHLEHSQWTGREMFNADLRVVDQDGQDTPVGEVGEIISAQNYLGMIGYYNMGEANRKAVRGGWIHTADLARVEGNGYFTIVDRMGDMIISGAENIYPKEIEAVISRHPDVLEVTVFGIPDEVYGESVCAFVVKKRDAQLDQQAVIEFCASKIASYKKPKRVEFVDELPKNASGKIMKKVLKEPFWKGHEKRV